MNETAGASPNRPQEIRNERSPVQASGVQSSGGDTLHHRAFGRYIVRSDGEHAHGGASVEAVG